MRIKTGLFFFLLFCCIITPISGIIDRYCITENIKKNLGKWEQIKNKYTLKIMNILRTAGIGSHFTASYEKKSIFFRGGGYYPIIHWFVLQIKIYKWLQFSKSYRVSSDEVAQFYFSFC